MADEGLREIQLNGKQLVFLFMAATVVAVVIFLCGVMVGRGVRVLRANELAVAAADPDADPTASPASVPPQSVSPQDGSAAISVSPTDTTYPGRLGLDGQDPPEELLDDVVKSPSVPPVVVPRPVPARTPPTPRKASAPDTAIVPGEPEGNGFVVQVAAVNDRRQAEAIAGRLSRKGYPSFVTTSSGSATPRKFRVRVGKYPERRKAQLIAARLEKEEQFKPWITR